MRSFSIVRALGVTAVLCAGCGEDAPAASVDPDSKAIKALLDGLTFAGGVPRAGRIPATTDSTVTLDEAASFALLEPGEAGLLPFAEDNPNDDDATAAVLLQFGDEDRHVEVPTSASVAGPGDINLSFELDTGVCDALCNRRYTIEMEAAILLDSDGVGALLQTEVVLDCRADGDEDRCEQGEQSESPAPDSAVPPEPDAAVDMPDGAGPPEDSSADAGSLIDERGGRVSLPDGAEAVIPAMAVTEPTPIALKVARDVAPLPSAVEGAGEAYVFEPHGATFDEPVTLRLPFTGSSTDAQVMFLVDESDDSWEPAEETPTFEDGVAVLEVTHFSVYQVVRPVPDVPADLCAQDNGGCDTQPMATCQAEGDRPSCTCPSGYQGSGLGAEGCLDTLECATDNGGCSETQECVEQVGGDPICDLDECATDNGGCGDPTYTTCDNQLDGANPICTDIDECATNNGGCGAAAYASCTNHPGEAPTCADIDECATNNGDCGDAALVTCMNEDRAAHSCTDIDECLTNNGGCGAPGYNTCTNNHAALPTCMDIDECAVGNGQCGDPAHVLCTNRSDNPVVCTRLWAQVEANDGPMCARRRDGTVACSGYDYSGGNDAMVTANPTGVIDVSTGQGNACVVQSDNRLTCYGYTGGGSIPVQTMAANTDPVQNFVDVEVGGYRVCALRTTGTLACYGATDGHGTTNVLDFDVSWTHVCVVHTDGTLQCFGTDTNGCVSGPNAMPGNPSDPNNRYAAVSTSNGGTCAVRENGTFICWGPASAHVTDANANDEFDYVAISMGDAHTCALHSDGTGTCWGADDDGRVSAVNVTEAAGNLAEITVGNYGLCVGRTDGSFHCYGSNTYNFQGLNPLGLLP